MTIPDSNAIAAIALALALGNPKVAQEVPSISKIKDVEGSVCKVWYSEKNRTHWGTGTVMGPVRKDGKYEILTAGHVVPKVGEKANIITAKGEKVTATVTVREPSCDLAWLVFDKKVDTTCAYLNEENPKLGSKIWHMGWGSDKPNNKEVGTLLDYENSQGYVRMDISVSSGDSGCGIFLEKNNKLLSVLMGGRENPMTFGGSYKWALKSRPRR